MPKKTQAASFEDFLKSPSRLAAQTVGSVVDHSKEDTQVAQAESRPAHGSQQSKAPSRKEKVGLTIDADIIDAIDDYIYHERKQGRRLKKNDVYEAALRQFLGMEEGDV